MRTYKDLIEDNRIIVSDYKKLIKDTIQLGSYSEMIHMYALSAVLKMPIRSYYPPQMSPELSSDCYTRKVVGRNVRTKSDPPITVMWTQMIKPRNVRSFVPNHFVCLTEREVQPELITIDDSDTSVYQNVTNMSDSTISDVHVNILNQNAKCVAFSTPVNFNIPEHHGLLTDLSDLDDSDDPVQFPPVTPVTKTTRTKRSKKNKTIKQGQTE